MPMSRLRRCANRAHLRTPMGAEPGAPAVPADRVQAMLPPQLLQPTEIVVLLIKPSPWFIVLGSLRSLAVIGLLLMAGLVLWRYQINYLQPPRLVAVAVALALLRLLWQLLEWLSRIYVLTDRRVVRVRGVLQVLVFEAQLSRIQNTDAVYSLVERLFGLGSILFSTAGTGAPEAVWEMVSRPLEVHQTVVQTINRYSGNHGTD